MDEYIEREAAVSSIMQKERHDFPADYFPDDEYAFNDGLVVAANALDEVPAADVATVVHGKWENNHCSVCGMIPMGEEIWDACDFCPPRFEFFMNYCPNCGARMDGDVE